MSLFGILVQERQPVQFNTELVLGYFRDVGLFAFFFLILWLGYVALLPLLTRSDPRARPFQLNKLTVAIAAVAFVIEVIGLVFLVIGKVNADPKLPSPFERYSDWVLAAGGALSLVSLLSYFVIDLVKFSPRRIGALAKLSFLEASRRRVLWIFLLFALIFLFPANWFRQVKLENEIRDKVELIFYTMTLLLLPTASLLAAFSIPNDLKHQTVYTIVTKPVERFEMVLGRFLGYLGLMTVALAAMAAFSLGSIWLTRFSDEAKAESYKARQVAYGDLSFKDLKKPGEPFKGQSVGREWEYRQYIEGRPSSSQRAVWSFVEIPAAEQAAGGGVPLEFEFDIFRMTKGEEGKGVLISFRCYTYQWAEKDAAEGDKIAAEFAKQRLIGAKPDAGGDAATWTAADKFAREHGYFEFRNKEISDYHTFSIRLPVGLIEKAREGAGKVRALADGTKQPLPRLVIEVKCESAPQYLGVAKADLYLLVAEGPFAVNFIKAAGGLWLRLAIIIGLAVTFSTYLSGVISWLAAAFLFVLGYAREFIETLATGKADGGGPFQALVRLARGDAINTNLDDVPNIMLAVLSDRGLQFCFNLLLKLVPDVTRLDWKNNVKHGFDVALAGDLGMGLLYTAAYLGPWLLLAYFVIKGREVAA